MQTDHEVPPGVVSQVELVVLLDDEGHPCGVAPKAEVHGLATPLHLAFSCWLLDDAGRVLLTRRADSKLTWPGIWTNAFCGHPAPDEPIDDAVRRRAEQELGTTVDALRPALPDFRYQATMADGTMENEVCPVYLAHPGADLAPRPDEVGAWRWVTVADLLDDVAAQPDVYSPWLRLQLPRLLDEGHLAIDLQASGGDSSASSASRSRTA